jgi:hypothetical protein
MNLDEFKASLTSGEPPPGISGVLTALWYGGNDDWDTAHHIAQDIASPNGYWVHAWLHRQEGDLGNAGYWYSRAGKPMPSGDPKKEWEGIVREILGQNT